MYHLYYILNNYMKKATCSCVPSPEVNETKISRDQEPQSDTAVVLPHYERVSSLIFLLDSHNVFCDETLIDAMCVKIIV